MDYDKVSMFYAGPTTVTQTHCLAPLRLPNIAPLQQTSAETVQTNKFLEPTQTPPSSSSSSSSSPSASLSIAPNADPFAAYADNFDLSLLPQECTTPTEHIPTSVYHYTSTTSSTPNLLRHVRMEAATAHTPQTPHAPQTPLTPQTPQIKIEQAWSFGSALSLPEEIKREPLTLSLQSSQSPTLLKSPNQLVPPPPYPNIYPSPQSSPAQSEYAFPHSLSQFGSCYDSVSSSRSSLHPSSPFAPFDASNIKQELHILPPSPPESNCEASSPHSTWTDIKSEPIDADVETLIDLNALLDKKSFNTSYKNTNKNSDSPNETSEQLMSPTALAQQQHQNQQQQQQQHQQQAHDHQLLREFLEDCICPMSCSMDEVNGNIEKVISMALEDTKSQAVEICAKLQISQDPSDWSTAQVHAWLRSTVAQFKLPEIADLELNFPEDGAAFILLSEEDFKQRAPQSGSDLYAQLEVWRYHFNSNAPESDDEDDMLPTTSATLCAAAADGAGNSVGAAPATKRNTGASVELKQRSGRNGGSHIHLWQFLKELLGDPHVHGTAIRWIDRNRGVFKIEDSVRVAKLWGGRKNRPAMNYDKLSRSIRQYYKKGIMKKTERSQRLVYQFCHPYQL